MSLVPRVLALALLVACVLPARGQESVADLIRLLGDDDAGKRRAAARKLEALGARALPALREAAKSHPDIDVRLRAGVLASAIEADQWGPVRAMGPGAAVKVAPPGLGYWFNRVAFLPDGKTAVVGGGAVILFDLETGKERRRVREIGGALHGLAVSRDGKSVLTGHTKGANLHLLAANDLASSKTFTWRTASVGVQGVALSPDGTRAAAACNDSILRVWDVKSGEALMEARAEVFSLAFSPDGTRVLAGAARNLPGKGVTVWDVKAGKVVKECDGHTNRVTGVAWLPDGKRALSASPDGTLRLWDLGTGKELKRYEHPGGAYDLALSADGKRAVSAGFGDRKVRVWDVEAGKLVGVFEGHVAPVLGVAISADGTRVLSSDAVACVRLWKANK